MRVGWIAIALLALLAGRAGAELVDGVAAIVGDEVILRSELDAVTDGAVRQIREEHGSVTRDELRHLRNEALQSLIDDRLLMQVATTGNLQATDEEIDQAVKNIASEEGIDPEGIYAAAAQQGLPRDEYRRQLGKTITRMKILSGTVSQRVNVTDEEVREVYQNRYGSARPGSRLRVLHILLPIPPDATAEQRAKVTEFAQQLRTRALETGNFPGLARTYSAAPSAADGGLTILVEAEAPAQILEALSGLSPGEITTLVETSHGVNLFQFLDRFDPSKVEFSEVEPRLRSELTERKTMPEFRKWLDELRGTRYIEVVQPDLK